MRTRARWLVGAICAAHLLMSASAHADGRNPGSLLVFAEFDDTNGRAGLLTITNTNPDPQQGSVKVEIVFINGTSELMPLCSETNVTIALSPNDTYTFLSRSLNPNNQKGYAYAFAKNDAGAAIAFDWLIGDNVLLDGVSNLDYAVNPYSFRAMPALGMPTDIDGDGIRDLNGVEYEGAPAKTIVPRFMGQTATHQSDLILINLTGGAQFTATLNFLVYNDNEEVFSRNFSFRCWTKLPLIAIAATFGQNFLSTFTNDNPAEIIGASAYESGWFEIDGHVAFSSSTQFLDPAFLGFVVERGGLLGGAELPFEMGKQLNGDLLPLGLNGDTN